MLRRRRRLAVASATLVVFLVAYGSPFAFKVQGPWIAAQKLRGLPWRSVALGSPKTFSGLPIGTGRWYWAWAVRLAVS